MRRGLRDALCSSCESSCNCASSLITSAVVLKKADCHRLFQRRNANAGPPIARQRMRLDQLRSVGLTAFETLAPILDELAAASDIAQQGAVAVAHNGLVVEVGLPILIAPGHLRPIFWVRGGDNAAEDVARR